MNEFSREKFKQWWRATEIVRQYQRTLFTFSDMQLPYVFVAEHGRFKDRSIVRKGEVLFTRPQIILPRYYAGPQFEEGFEHAGSMPPEAVYVLRSMGMPYSHVTNRLVAEEQTEYGSLQTIISRLDRQMEADDNSDTALIKGSIEGADVSLMRYSLGLAIKSAPANVSEFFEHLKRQRGEPIRPDERITDEDIQRLFG
jgi:hypothetical protein